MPNNKLDTLSSQKDQIKRQKNTEEHQNLIDAFNGFFVFFDIWLWRPPGSGLIITSFKDSTLGYFPLGFVFDIKDAESRW